MPRHNTETHPKLYKALTILAALGCPAAYTLALLAKVFVVVAAGRIGASAALLLILTSQHQGYHCQRLAKTHVVGQNATTWTLRLAPEHPGERMPLMIHQLHLQALRFFGQHMFSRTAFQRSMQILKANKDAHESLAKLGT